MDFFGIGFPELAVILIVGFLVLGPAKMVDTAKTLGKTVRDFQRAASEVPRVLSLEDEPKKEEPSATRQQLPEKPSDDQHDQPVPRA